MCPTVLYLELVRIHTLPFPFKIREVGNGDKDKSGEISVFLFYAIEDRTQCCRRHGSRCSFISFQGESLQARNRSVGFCLWSDLADVTVVIDRF